jgi:hypothetical protein
LLDASLSNQEKCFRQGLCVGVQQVRINLAEQKNLGPMPSKLRRRYTNK